MQLARRSFLRTALGATAASALAPRVLGDDARKPSTERLREVANAPVLRVEGIEKPVVIATMDLLRNGREYLVRVRSKDGGEGWSVANSMHLVHTYPIFLNRVAPFFVGKDARELEPLLWELYRHDDNYKYQGLALWVCTAAAEFAVLDLLGKVSGRSVGDLLGGFQRREIAVYRASGTRGNTPEEEVADLRRIVAESGAKALKFRLGGRMSRNADSLPGRTEALIPLVREAFGPEMTLYADANSSYDAAEAIRVGRLMEEHGYAFYEEPCRFDHLEETRAVADALSIPVAGGEQEAAEEGFRWMIANRAVDIVQPDLHYHGGFVRSMRVARMAHEAGMLCTPHMSGSGLGYLDAAVFAACIPNPVPFTEYKGSAEVPVTSASSSLKVVDGKLQVPDGPGFGITIDPAYLREAVEVRSRG
ncbi:mandelate racemase/muconate lactonizing enzyme family protein [Planctomyces sp. SH-PL62]|uniref:mandelate racemase/muconate lactonizing enzyme family protein n=1 Tax=Planctomyces sp. SH-PL62 TaxID=1636152 RepID=UPI00078B3CAF|nr:mandelate racemase/muconate lactonizing enzyme family protein [Planctomyces sp. SH-PL62]AMV38207.1 Putative isomerase YitF [Planctomyces sp. SH-PL62]